MRSLPSLEDVLGKVSEAYLAELQRITVKYGIMIACKCCKEQFMLPVDHIMDYRDERRSIENGTDEWISQLRERGILLQHPDPRANGKRSRPPRGKWKDKT